ncbi:sensor histidine kinase [Streptomyces sp. NPDC057743]|uniref:sensor histidine kinase n=1 Tax=Streptomyces sp. NPDC057743 TaxID=3346236 RepID=UPI003678DAB6
MVSAVALIAVVGAVISTVTAIALHSYLQGKLDDQLFDAIVRAELPRPHDPQRNEGLEFVAMPGQPFGSVGARVAPDGSLGSGARVNRSQSRTPSERLTSLSGEQLAALASVPRDAKPHTRHLPRLGSYRLQYAKDGALVFGMPLNEVNDTVGRLVLIECCVTGSGLVAAGIAGSAMVGIALRPLRRVAATATRVSELPLHQGEVALHVRVPLAEADARTEVGQVGAALNRMLGHVGSALSARQESETRVRRFVADASHELRTPLASIRGYAELTRRGQERPGPETRRALGRIESEAERMTGLVEDLLLLARLDSGRPLSYATVDLAPLVVDALSDARAAGPGHRWRLELPDADAPALVRGDADRLHQILVNLLANARTHTPEGTTVTARVRARASQRDGGAVQRDGGAVQLEVQDDGPGIPGALLPHVFERFARGDASRSRSVGGGRGGGSTGLGLAIVQAVVAAHDGTVEVASVPGRTVFTVTLPAAGQGVGGGARGGGDGARAPGPPPSHSRHTASPHGGDRPIGERRGHDDATADPDAAGFSATT